VTLWFKEMTFLRTLKFNTILSLGFLTLTLSQQYLFYALKGMTIVWFRPEKYLLLFLLFFVMSFVKGKKSSLMLLSFIMIANFFQMIHLSYFGTQILPIEISLLFSQIHEIKGTLFNEIHHILTPLIMTALPLWAGFILLKKTDSRSQFRIVTILTILYLIYNPARTLLTKNSWGRQPSTRELSGFNAYLSLSYFLGRILPQKISGQADLGKNSSDEIILTKTSRSHWDKVILIIGESLTPRHMGVYDYTRPTTPYLSSLKNGKNAHFGIALTSAVSTDVSLAFLFNMGFGPSGRLKASTGEHCLFKLAAEQGLGTHFFSNQSEQQLRYIIPYFCPKYLTEQKFLEQLSGSDQDENSAPDFNLLTPLPGLLQNKSRQFIVLHQRGSHAPWNLRSRPEMRKFQGDGDQRVNDYDNSVLEFDAFWKEFEGMLAKTLAKTLVIYISDHGEVLGENGKWGHGFFDHQVFEVPLIIRSFNQDLPEIKLPRFSSQINVISYLAAELGYTSSHNPENHTHDFVIFGNDIDGLAGKAMIEYQTDGSYKYRVD